MSLQFSIMDSRTLGERLRLARTRARLTQDQVAARCGISRSLISQWETGVVHEVSAGNLACAARVLRVSLDWLLEGDGNGIAEPAPAAYGEHADLLALWADLTDSQRSALLERMRGLAAHNRELLAELSRRR